MPAPARTSIDAIVRAAADLLEADGPAGMSMQAVGARVGVRAPSLYKHVSGRGALVRLVAEDAARDLGERLDASAPFGTPPKEALGAAARALRSFAHERPAAFRLVLSPAAEEDRLDPETARRSSAAVVRIAAELAGPEHALEAARTLTAWASGFVAMELAGAFRMGGDVDAAFEFGVERIADALAG
jgi:AcrR family transcriptional regulator